MLPMTHTDGDQHTKLVVDFNGRDRPACITAQTMDGKVYIKYDDEEQEYLVDLASLKYRWV